MGFELQKKRKNTKIEKFVKKTKKIYVRYSSHLIIWDLVGVMNLILWAGYKNNSCIREIQENLIKILLQTNLPYILLTMAHAYYCAPYSKWPCIKHEVNMCYLCCMTLFVLEPSILFFQVVIVWVCGQTWTRVRVSWT